MFRILGLAAGLLACGAVMAQERATIPLDTGWRFRQESGLTGVETLEFDDTIWASMRAHSRASGSMPPRVSNPAAGISWSSEPTTAGRNPDHRPRT